MQRQSRIYCMFEMNSVKFVSEQELLQGPQIGKRLSFVLSPPFDLLMICPAY
jgi:hypothetical protein